MLAIVLALGFAVVGCGKGSTSSNGEGDGGGGTTAKSASSEPGTLTITGLPKKSFTASVPKKSDEITASSGIGSVIFAVGMPEAKETNVNNGNVFKLEVFTYGGGAWTGSGKRQVILMSMDDGDPWDRNNQAVRFATVNFTNGSATVKYSSFTTLTK